jgi:hypothetical protein
MNRRRGHAGGWDPSSIIPELERWLVGNPDDAEAHMRLACAYEHSSGGDSKAKFHYLQHLVLKMNHPDAATALSALQESISEDGGNHIARIHIGTILAYQNEFDKAIEELKRGTVWKAHESSHYRFNVVSGSTADNEIERIIEERERGMTDILALFELSYKPSQPIVNYFYESRMHKALLTGDQMPAHALTKKGEIHSIYGLEFKITGLHEDVHIILRQSGRPPKFLEEGAAMYADCLHGSIPLNPEVLKQAAPGAVESLINDEAFIESNTFQSYPFAASFVGFLIETYGVEQFKALYASRARDIVAEFGRIYGKDLRDLETAWLERLRRAGRGTEDGEEHFAGR